MSADAPLRDPFEPDPRELEEAARLDDPGDLLRLAPGLARIGVTAAARTVEWSARTYARGASRVVRAALTGESPADLFGAAGNELRDNARRLLGVADELTGRVPAEPAADGAVAPETSSRRRRVAAAVGRNGASATASEPLDPAAELKARGRELLRRSADVHEEESAHPAYARILDELSPDEARILRFMAQDGPQPSVDVRTGVGPIDIASHLIAPGLNMIGAHAGCRHMDRVPAYLNNLYRLGLIWFSREPVADPLAYQVLEAQPDVVEALRNAGRVKKTVRRSILLTPFGDDFCRLCL